MYNATGMAQFVHTAINMDPITVQALRAGGPAMAALSAAVVTAGGSLSAAARALGVPLRTAQYWQAHVPAVARMIAQVRARAAAVRLAELGPGEP